MQFFAVLSAPGGAKTCAEPSFGRRGWGASDLRQSIFQLMATFKQVAMAGNDAQRKRTAELLDETRRKIYALLASDES